MSKENRPKSEPNYIAVLEGIEHQLKRLVETLDVDRTRTRWYEVSWDEQLPYDAYQVRKRRRAYEAYDQKEVRAEAAAQLAYESVTKFVVAPLRPEQCKNCCASDWHQDGDYCCECGLNEEQAILKRREGRSYDRGY